MSLAWIPELPYPGRLAVWRCPSVCQGAVDPADAAQLTQAGVHTLVCLLEPEELVRYEETLEARAAAVRALGIHFRSLPIEDYQPPTRRQFATLLSWTLPVLRSGQVVLIHCMAGLGRAGTVAAGLLVHTGMPPRDAMALVRWVRPGSIQSDTQERFLKLLGSLRRQPPDPDQR